MFVNYYKVFDDSYISGKEVIYSNADYINILKDYIDPFDINTLKQVREIAIRGLDMYPNIIKRYWDFYRLDNYKETININTIDHFLEQDGNYNIILMPLDTLVMVTKNVELLENRMSKYVEISNDFSVLEDKIMVVLKKDTDNLLKYKLIINQLLK
ncbi:hypothetical protein [Minisyncoccus archaeiphilus]|uniref:hypothetical protein n=1 Tax=Minisyncoccus archaeiphilus TaxID=3238481 RepID=UPI00399CE85A